MSSYIANAELELLKFCSTSHLFRIISSIPTDNEKESNFLHINNYSVWFASAADIKTWERVRGF
jgi:hypothetical protein